MRNLLVIPVVLVAALAWRNPVDMLIRGKWVRHFDTGKGEATSTLCIPAESPAEIDGFRGDLPARVRAMHEAGATVVAIDLDLSAPHASDAALRDAAATGKTLFARSAGASAFAEPSGLREMESTWFLPMVLGAVVASDTGVPLAAAALAAHLGTEATPQAGGSARIGDFLAYADGHLMPFMPYEVPFIHWTDTATWSTAKGRIVFVGACKADRELTRFGRQPGAVAHGELVETWRDARRPKQAHELVDVGVAMFVYAAGLLARIRAGLGGAAAVGAVAILTSLGVALTGYWPGLSGLLVATIMAIVVPKK